MNQYFEFPEILDLKPYSYHEKMRQEEKSEQQLEEEAKIQNKVKDSDTIKKGENQ
jgi:hypothetical protein